VPDTNSFEVLRGNFKLLGDRNSSKIMESINTHQVLHKPLEIVQTLLDAHIAQNGDIHSDWGVPKHFESLLPVLWDKVGKFNSKCSNE
jgi:hypothetical protein